MTAGSAAQPGLARTRSLQSIKRVLSIRKWGLVKARQSAKKLKAEVRSKTKKEGLKKRKHRKEVVVARGEDQEKEMKMEDTFAKEVFAKSDEVSPQGAQVSEASTNRVPPVAPSPALSFPPARDPMQMEEAPVKAVSEPMESVAPAVPAPVPQPVVPVAPAKMEVSPQCESDHRETTPVTVPSPAQQPLALAPEQMEVSSEPPESVPATAPEPPTQPTAQALAEKVDEHTKMNEREESAATPVAAQPEPAIEAESAPPGSSPPDKAETSSLKVEVSSEVIEALQADKAAMKVFIESLSEAILNICSPSGPVTCQAREISNTEAPQRAAGLLKALSAMRSKKDAAHPLEVPGLQPTILKTPRDLRAHVVDKVLECAKGVPVIACFANKDAGESSAQEALTLPVGQRVQVRQSNTKTRYEADVLADFGSTVKVAYGPHQTEEIVKRIELRRLPPPEKLQFGVGDLVLAKYGRGFHDAEVLRFEEDNIHVKYKFDDSEESLHKDLVKPAISGSSLETEDLYLFGQDEEVTTLMMKLCRSIIGKGGVDRDFFAAQEHDAEDNGIGLVVVDLRNPGKCIGKDGCVRRRMCAVVVAPIQVFDSRISGMSSSSSGGCDAFALGIGYKLERVQCSTLCRMIDGPRNKQRVRGRERLWEEKLSEAMEAITRRLQVPQSVAQKVMLPPRQHLIKIEDDCDVFVFELPAVQEELATLVVIGQDQARQKAALRLMAVAEVELPGSFVPEDGKKALLELTPEERGQLAEEVLRLARQEKRGLEQREDSEAQWREEDKEAADGEPLWKSSCSSGWWKESTKKRRSWDEEWSVRRHGSDSWDASRQQEEDKETWWSKKNAYDSDWQGQRGFAEDQVWREKAKEWGESNRHHRRAPEEEESEWHYKGKAGKHYHDDTYKESWQETSKQGRDGWQERKWRESRDVPKDRSSHDSVWQWLKENDWPQTLWEWQQKQDKIFPLSEYDPLPMGWVRVMSRSRKNVYYARVADALSVLTLEDVYDSKS